MRGGWQVWAGVAEPCLGRSLPRLICAEQWQKGEGDTENQERRDWGEPGMLMTGGNSATLATRKARL